MEKQFLLESAPAIEILLHVFPHKVDLIVFAIFIKKIELHSKPAYCRQPLQLDSENTADILLLLLEKKIQ